MAFSLAAFLLAAGRSSRMGRPKLLLPWGGTSVLGHLINQWQVLKAKQIAIVCAAADSLIQAELDRLGFSANDRVLNAAPDRGMFSSIQCAAQWPGWRADPGRLDREGRTPHTAGPSPNQHVSSPYFPPSLGFLPMVRRHGHSRAAPSRGNHRSMVAADRGVHPHWHHQRRQRGRQPVDQAGGSQRLRFPQPRQPTTAVTLRKRPGSLATRQARLTSKTRHRSLLIRFPCTLQLR